MQVFYERLHEKDEKQKVKMLLDYLSRHEKHREETLARYEEEASKKVMEMWFKYIPKNLCPECFENISIRSNMSVDDVIGIAMHFNNCLVELYMSLIENTSGNEVRNVFICLLERMKKEKMNLARDALWLNDI
jgi:hypothetical protein